MCTSLCPLLSGQKKLGPTDLWGPNWTVSGSSEELLGFSPGFGQGRFMVSVAAFRPEVSSMLVYRLVKLRLESMQLSGKSPHPQPPESGGSDWCHSEGVKGSVRVDCLHLPKYVTKTILLFNDNITLIQIYRNVITTCMYLYHNLWINNLLVQLVNKQTT